jgi:hypothetical protein
MGPGFLQAAHDTREIQVCKPKRNPSELRHIFLTLKLGFLQERVELVSGFVHRRSLSGAVGNHASSSWSRCIRLSESLSQPFWPPRWVYQNRNCRISGFSQWIICRAPPGSGSIRFPYRSITACYGLTRIYFCSLRGAGSPPNILPAASTETNSAPLPVVERGSPPGS